MYENPGGEGHGPPAPRYHACNLSHHSGEFYTTCSKRRLTENVFPLILPLTPVALQVGGTCPGAHQHTLCSH